VKSLGTIKSFPFSEPAIYWIDAGRYTIWLRSEGIENARVEVGFILGKFHMRAMRMKTVSKASLASFVWG